MNDFLPTQDKFNLTLSLDVLYHIINLSDFKEYLDNLFNLSSKYVIILTLNKDINPKAKHMIHREFTKYIPKNVKLLNVFDLKLNYCKLYFYEKI